MGMQALIMGFGGTGAFVLTYLKELTMLKYGKVPDFIKFLLFDTIAGWAPGGQVDHGGQPAETLPIAEEQGASLNPNDEYYYLRDHDPDLERHAKVLLAPEGGQPNYYRHLKDWLHAPYLATFARADQLQLTVGAGQIRQIGRFAIFQNDNQILQQMTSKISELEVYAGLDAVNIWIITSAAGGTGAGCLLDAAFLAREASRRRHKDIKLSGVIAFPEIYNDRPGVSHGRAYSLFRELERLQMVNIDQQEWYRPLRHQVPISAEVIYRDDESLASYLDPKLFDYLFYLGRPCQGSEDRKSFFSSVANAIDPSLDAGAGLDLLQNSINVVGAGSSMGAARLYVPEELLADLFAWEEVERFLLMAAPVEEERIGDEVIVTDVLYGHSTQREAWASQQIDRLLPLWTQLRNLAGQREEDKKAFAKNNLHPRDIVEKGYQFAGDALAGLQLSPQDKQEIRLTYVNPFISLSEPNESKVEKKNRRVKTLEELKTAKQEKPKDPAEHFAKALTKATEEYLRGPDEQNTLEQGLKLVSDKMQQSLANKVDGIVIARLGQGPLFATAPREPQGTSATQLFQELRFLLGDGGPFGPIEQQMQYFVNLFNAQESGTDQESGLQQRAVDTAAKLQKTRPRLFGLSTGELVRQQERTRKNYAAYISCRQQRRLLENMKELLGMVKERFRLWHVCIEAMLQGLALNPTESLLHLTRKELTLLRGRLHRLAKNPTTMISILQNPLLPDVNMMGYVQELRRLSTDLPGGLKLSDQTRLGSSWTLSLAGETPSLRLAIGQEVYAAQILELGVAPRRGNLYDLHQELRTRYRKHIATLLGTRDIFDYLQYLQIAPQNVANNAIALRLNQASEALINANVPVESFLVYKAPPGPVKNGMAAALFQDIGAINPTLQPPLINHTDKNSVTLIQFKKPAMAQIVNLTVCRDDYLKWQGSRVTNSPAHDEQVRSAWVWHPFRAELEAYFVERYFALEVWRRDPTTTDHIAPRILRLLEHPARVKAFLNCLATGAVRQSPQTGLWVWDSPRFGELPLTLEPQQDLLKAAIVYILQQREATVGGTREIKPEEAHTSALTRVNGSVPALNDRVKEFVEKELDVFLDQHFLQKPGQPQAVFDKEKVSFKLILDFYSRGLGTELRDRMW